MKYLTSIILLTIATFPALGQLKVHLGGGINLSDINYSNLTSDFSALDSTETSANIYISARPEVGLTEKLSVSLDIQFSQKGFNNNNQSSNNPGEYKFQYLDLLPQIQYLIIRQVSVHGGLGLAIRTSEKYKFNDVWQETKTRFSDRTDPTYVFGVRFYPIKKLSLQLQVAGSLKNFSVLEFTDSVGNELDIRSRLTNIQIGMAYQIF